MQSIYTLHKKDVFFWQEDVHGWKRKLYWVFLCILSGYYEELNLIETKTGIKSIPSLDY